MMESCYQIIMKVILFIKQVFQPVFQIVLRLKPKPCPFIAPIRLTEVDYQAFQVVGGSIYNSFAYAIVFMDVQDPNEKYKRYLWLVGGLFPNKMDASFAELKNALKTCPKTSQLTEQQSYARGNVTYADLTRGYNDLQARVNQYLTTGI